MKRNGGVYYLGEWHSHPNGVPKPSGMDDENQFAISNDKKTDCPESILLIIGGGIKTNPSLGCFVYSKRNGKIILSIDYN